MKYIYLTLICASIGIFTGLFLSSKNIIDFELLPFIVYGFNFDTICIAGKVKNIHETTGYNRIYKRFEITFDGPWYYYDTSSANDPCITNTKNIAMIWFKSNQNYQWNYFTNEYKKYGSGWMCGGVLTDKWNLTIVTKDDNINYYDLKGKFIFHQFSCLWKQKVIGQFGSEHNIQQSRMEVK